MQMSDSPQFAGGRSNSKLTVSKRRGICESNLVPKRKQRNKCRDDFLKEIVSSNAFPRLDPLEVPFRYFDHTTAEMSRRLERLRCTVELRKLYHTLKISLNQFEGPKDARYFNILADEDFGDNIVVDNCTSNFKSARFAWEKFTGLDGQLEGLSTAQKKAVVFRVTMSYPGDSPQRNIATGINRSNNALVTMSGKKRKKEDQNRRITRGAAADSSCEEENSGALVSSTLPKLPYRNSVNGRDMCIVTGRVPEGVFCSSSGRNVKRTTCLCRFVVFQENSFSVMLPVLDQLLQLRFKIATAVTMDEVGIYFSSVFGVTNIAARGKQGARGFQFYFHIDRNLGTFCLHAMSTLIGEPNWQKVLPYICDFSLKKGKVHKSAVELLNAEKVNKQVWVIDKESVDTSCFMDIIIGYACYMKDAKFTANKSGVYVHEYSPDRQECLEKCFQYGLNAAPVPAGINTQRKCEYSGPPMEFLRKFDTSNHWPPADGSTSFYMSNPQHKHLFKTSNKFIRGTVDGIKGLHGVDIFAVDLAREALAGVDYLRTSFGVFFGPGGLGHSGSTAEPFKMTADPRVPFVYSCTVGDFGSDSMFDFIPCHYYSQIVDQVKAKFVKTEAFLDKFPDDSKYACVGAMVCKVNSRTKSKKLLVQLPHLIMAHDKLVRAQKDGCLLVRIVVPLDSAGCAIIVWPPGNDERGVMLFIPPNTALVLPVTVPTSDCPKYTPSGQGRAEIILAFHDAKEELSEVIKLEEHDYHYPFGCSFRTKKTEKFINLDGIQAEKRFPRDAISEFVQLFDAIN